jgi:hypothetical protein
VWEVVGGRRGEGGVSQGLGLPAEVPAEGLHVLCVCWLSLPFPPAACTAYTHGCQPSHRHWCDHRQVYKLLAQDADVTLARQLLPRLSSSDSSSSSDPVVKYSARLKPAPLVS